MFSCHRRKVYRSPTGCCICKAKSSSSRFTDSKRYEEDFLECFKLSTPRQGEICNACVLLVKRWKKLPVGTDRNWKHVVDAKAGPGVKSLTKFKSKNKKNNEITDLKLKKKKRFEREDSPALSDKSENNDDVEMTEVDFLSEDGPSAGSSRTASPGGSDSDTGSVKNRRQKKAPTKRKSQTIDVSDFIDLDYFTQEETCCGIVFRGQNNELIIDDRYYKPCPGRLARMAAAAKARENKTENKTASDGSVTKLYSDCSSDSGYDDSSNPGAITDCTSQKKEQVSIEKINSQIPKINN